MRAQCRHVARWFDAADTTDPAEFCRRMARKALLAAAGLRSIHAATLTTDRERSARRGSEAHPSLHTGLEELLAWIVEQFATDLDVWTTTTWPTCDQRVGQTSHRSDCSAEATIEGVRDRHVNGSVLLGGCSVSRVVAGATEVLRRNAPICRICSARWPSRRGDY